jgi:uncharacterized protein (DUF58 family)
MKDRRRFLELGALASLEHLRFAPRRRLEGTYSGRYASRRLGGAGEFADFREYAGGEDLRRLDWKVLARTGKAFTRVYQDENNLVCTLVLDASGSMTFGSPRTKLEYAQYLTTALGYLIGRQQDQVGLAIVSETLDIHLPAGGTAGHVAAVHDAIENAAPRPTTNLGEALHKLFQRLPHRGVLVVLTDFLVEPLDDAFAALRLFRHRGWEIIALHLVHPDEEQLPDGVAYRFVGLEDEGTIEGSPEMIQGDYRRRFEAHAGMVRTLALATGCDYLRVSTAVPYLQTLGHFLVERTG